MGLLDILLPPSCAGCGRYGDALCGGCGDRVVELALRNDPFIAADPGIVLGEAMIVGTAAFAHRDEVQRILRRLKYGGGRHLAEPLAAHATPALRRLLAVAGTSVLVPVPLHRARQRDRGYNQAAILASALGRRTGQAVWPAIVRARATERQHGLDRATRLRNIRHAMTLDPTLGSPTSTMPAAAIVVDDILTTGATLEACAHILRAAGVERVYGFAIAREV
jgi:ComF family protein